MRAGKIALFCKAGAAGWFVQLCKYVQCALAEIFKNEARAFYFFFLLSRPFSCPVALLVKSSQSGMNVSLCHDMSVVTRYCQCVRCLFLHVPQTSSGMNRWECVPHSCPLTKKFGAEQKLFVKPLNPNGLLPHVCALHEQQCTIRPCSRKIRKMQIFL